MIPRRPRVHAAWWWLLFGVWAVLQLAIAWEVDRQGQGPIDFLTYQIAAQKVAQENSPYTTAAASMVTWRAYHRLEERVRATDMRGPDAELPSPQPPPRVRPGPYLYLPTLALLIAQTEPYRERRRANDVS